MDFDFSEDQQELRELAARIFADLADHASQRRTEMAAAADDTLDPRFDRRLWSALADAGILGLAVGEDHGGAGLGFLEACIAVEEAGRAAAPVPLTTATVLGALPLQRFGSEEIRKTWLPRLVSGEALATAALGSVVGDPGRPAAIARRAGDGEWRLDGGLSNVASGMVADAVVVAALSDEGIGLFLVEPDAHGLTRERQQATDGRVEARIELDGLELGAQHLLVAPGAGGEEAHRWCIERAQAALCVEIAGACRAALELTARYTAERVQFDKPVATFQAVGQRAADAYIDTEAVRLTAWQAAWRLDRELPAASEVAVAKFWADDGAQRVVHAAQHLHGGVGVDRDYPLHRYYLTVKHLAPTLGGATASLLRLGDLMAEAPA